MPVNAIPDIRWIQQIDEVPPSAWDALAGALATPFLEWEWLRLLEVSGSVTAEKGWLPHHLTLWRGDDLVAAAPLYIKGHSVGEFVFDHAWADAARRLDVDYYPKLVGMSPFSPTIGYRFLIAPGEDPQQITALMVSAIDHLVHRYRLGGCSFNYVDPDWGRHLRQYGFLSWTHQSFAWHNQDYRSFDDYLAIFKSNQRRNIRRERKAMSDQDIQLVPIAGSAITHDLFPHMYRLYTATNAQFGPWGCKYLTEDFFLGLYERYRERILLIAAYQGDTTALPIGMSFLLVKGNRMYGRYWGASRAANALHFNACYYRPIEWAIEKGIRIFDPGIGGEHKIRRGFEAVPNYSYHRFRDDRMQEVLRLNIGRINHMEQAHIDAINSERPLAETP
ncbi:MAG: GNAT family N-acetyltransferase [Desulfobacterales bacterium]